MIELKEVTSKEDLEKFKANKPEYFKLLSIDIPAKRGAIQELGNKVESIKMRICDEYCKYPAIWDVEKEGCELFESRICAECPFNDL